MSNYPVPRVNAGLVRVEAPGDYATLNSNQLRDVTGMSKATPEGWYILAAIQRFCQRTLAVQSQCA